MSVLNVAEIKQSLQKKGFKLDPNRKKHIYYFFYYNGEKTALNTHVSHGHNDINDHLISMMAKETKLDKPDFVKLIDCHLSEQEYIKKQIENGNLV